MSDSNPVVHFEMPYKDAKRVSDFYSKAFGWNMKTMSEDKGNYVMAQTTETGENMRPTTRWAINGGFFPSQDAPPHVVISVDDIQAAMKRVTDAGGKVTDEPIDIPGVGKYVAFTDTEGSRVSILQPNM